MVEPKLVTVLASPLLSAIEVTRVDVEFEVTILLMSAPSSHNWHPEIDVGLVKGDMAEMYG
jgi:hypothetical protein